MCLYLFGFYINIKSFCFLNRFLVVIVDCNCFENFDCKFFCEFLNLSCFIFLYREFHRFSFC